jgi:Glycosyl transferase family 2
VQAVILVPTRNRPDLAAAAVESVRSQLPEGVEIVVSDNSSEAEHRLGLHERLKPLLGGQLRLISPPEPLAMTAHWTWALDQVLKASDPSHVAVLTDRMVFKPSRLPALINATTRYPDEVISYNHDMLDDVRQPVELRLDEWSGQLVRIRSCRLLQMASKADWHPALPRMLNCIVPTATLRAIGQRFGSVFASTSPDHSFAYRCLVVRDSILYFDEALMVHYALDRSNGASYGRGIPSEDNLDFTRRLGTVPMNAWAPVPGFHTTMNAIVSEYCFVRNEAGAALPAVDMPRYLDAMESGIPLLEDPTLRARMEALLAESDALYAPRRRSTLRLRRWTSRASTLMGHPTRASRLLIERAARALAQRVGLSRSVSRGLRRLGLLVGGPRSATFSTSQEAIAAAGRTRRPANRHGTHLLRLTNEADLRRWAPGDVDRTNPSAVNSHKRNVP